MSKYTTEIRYICEQLSTDKGSINDIINSSAHKIFDFSYPIFDNNYKSTLENKILKHYYTREIGFETVGLWKLKLETKLNEIMPYYNTLYKSILTKFNPNYEVDLYTEGKRNSDGIEKNTGTVTNHESKTGKELTSNKPIGKTIHENTRTGNYEDKTDDTNTRTDNLMHKQLFSDTPQGGLTGVDNEEYLTNYTKNLNGGTQKNELDGKVKRTYNNLKDRAETSYEGYENTTTRTPNLNADNKRTDDLTKTINNTNDYIEHVYGIRNGSTYISMIKDFRSQIINIDMLIIDELNDLFMNIY